MQASFASLADLPSPFPQQLNADPHVDVLPRREYTFAQEAHP